MDEEDLTHGKALIHSSTLVVELGYMHIFTTAIFSIQQET